MVRAGKWNFVLVVAAISAMWAGVSLTAQDSKPAPDAKDAKAVDLSALKEAVATAAKRGENVDEIRTALAALEKVKPTAQAGRVPPELQALRDAVDAAARKGENVEAISKELLTIEMAVAGKSLAKPKPEPKADPEPMPIRPGFPNPGVVPFPNVPFPALPNPGGGIGGAGGGIDIETFNKAMELRRKALDMMVQGRKDPEAQKEAQKLLAEANELMQKAVKGGGGAGAPVMPLFPDVGRIPDRARLGIRMDRVPAVAVEQLGLEPNTGIVVAQVTPGSAAEKAGLKVHDIILEFAGKPVTDNTEDFIRRVNEIKTGEKVDMVVLRKGKKVDVKGVELPEPVKQPVRPQPFPALPGLLPDQLPNGRPVVPPAFELPPGINPPMLRPAAGPGIPAPVVIPAGFNSINFNGSDTGFTLNATKGTIKYAITGAFEAGQPVVSKVEIEKDGRTENYGATDKLPADAKTDVEALMKTVQPKK